MAIDAIGTSPSRINPLPINRVNGSQGPTPGGPLGLTRFSDLAASVTARGPRKWLVRDIWPAGDYGVHGAEPKAGKTWNMLDLAVSVSTGTPWLGSLPVETNGPVIVYAGEGGESNLVRRVRAIAESHGIGHVDFPLSVCTRVPHLSDDAHMAELARQVKAIRPVLVLLDPLYLAAGGANGADVYAMGRLLERPQHICQDQSAALFVVTHYNRSRDLKGAARLTGAGPAEWGRVLIGAAVKSSATDPLTKASDVTTELTVSGGEIPEQTILVQRRIRADDPSDLDSPLHYEVSAAHVAAADEDTLSGVAKPRKQPITSVGEVLRALSNLGRPATTQEIGEWIKTQRGRCLDRSTVSKALATLEHSGDVALVETLNTGAKSWALVER